MSRVLSGIAMISLFIVMVIIAGAQALLCAVARALQHSGARHKRA